MICRFMWASALSSPVRLCLYRWGDGVERGQLLQPLLVVLVQPGLVVVDEDRRRDVHGVDQDQSLLNAALADDLLDLGVMFTKPIRDGMLKVRCSV